MEWVKQYGWILVFGAVGVGLFIYGVWDVVAPGEVKVEIIKGSEVEDKSEREIVVHMAGAIEKPGVYKLSTRSRIGDALVVAGGLSALADRKWVETNLNLAQELVDGEKVYIPELKAGLGGQEHPVSENQVGKININSASVTELDSLEGIGQMRAETIVKNRPYKNTEELVSRAKIPQSVYENIKNMVSVY